MKRVNGDLAFLHLSDIHFNAEGLTDAFDLDVSLRNELERDVKRVVERLGDITGVLVTGDLVFNAEVKQFSTAIEWLGKLCDILGCKRSRVWTVPGNHDVYWPAIRESELIQGLHKKIRDVSPQDLDDTLKKYLKKDKEAGPILFRPLENYNDLAGKYSCVTSPNEPAWTDDLSLNDDSILRLCGLNSTIVSDEFDDKDLVLGSVQSDRALLRGDGVEYLVLCHHPPDWLLDGDSVEDSFSNLARIQLFGHKHTYRSRRTGDVLRLSAGAVHPNKREPKWEPRYNFLTIAVAATEAGRSLRVTVLPRIWKEAKREFQADFDKDGKDYEVHDLPIPAFDGAAMVETPKTEEAVGDAPQPDVEGGTMTTESEKSGMGNPTRHLVYRFLLLPFGEQITIVRSLGLFLDKDTVRTSIDICRLACKRAREERKLEALWKAVEAAHGNGSGNINPFKDQ